MIRAGRKAILPCNCMVVRLCMCCSKIFSSETYKSESWLATTNKKIEAFILRKSSTSMANRVIYIEAGN
jgi:hypothetical protein